IAGFKNVQRYIGMRKQDQIGQREERNYPVHSSYYPFRKILDQTAAILPLLLTQAHQPAVAITGSHPSSFGRRFKRTTDPLKPMVPV
ncbi:MAG TPA: hypothetical protein VGH29_16195, partial [Candidatus Binataceae bacterium]